MVSALALSLLLSSVTTQAPSVPDCGDEELEARTNCMLSTSDDTGWRLIFAFRPEGEDARLVDVLLVAVDGVPTDQSTYALERGFLPPRLIDVDGDGAEDLLLPLATGVVNSDWHIAFGTGLGFADMDAEALNGHTVQPVAPGLFAVHARGSASSHSVVFHAREGFAVRSEAVVSVTFEDEGAQCRLVTEGAARGEEFYCQAALSN